MRQWNRLISISGRTKQTSRTHRRVPIRIAYENVEDLRP
ncbi:unnamed protein product [Mycetohabitans rhizoxinica HKI 454]|uniref:Uncharacterized protein n=1 Tax=Mycetohabitans rhizoxinica (strain DSM 19002 / CIP 109453 / HKI 454) TaxID=882378 RepID=E5AMB7_MYCRK|nr:unnamed protein product [Mycetohabitans rhizoxinica HKI 454]